MFDAESLIHYGGLLLVFLAVYCQTGLFFCFFIPSGAFLFTTGIFIATGDLHGNVFLLSLVLVIASILGNLTGYFLGRKAGPLMYQRKESRFFKRRHLDKAEAFYQNYGNVALTAGLFFPIIRTFSPIVAGIIKLDLRRFLLFTFIGSVLWITSHVLAGYLIGIMPFLKQHLNYIVIGIILLVTLPSVTAIVRRLNKAGKEAE